MTHIILTGPTGLVGSAVLSHCLSSPSISRLTLLSRRPVPLADNHPKATVIQHADFASYPDALLSQLSGATACIWAQGISSRGMKEDDYTKITVDYPLAAAKAFSGLNARFNFVYVSGDGADPSGKSRMMFGRVKGRAERELLALQTEHPSLRVYNTRPAAIDPQGRYLAARKPSWADKLATGLGGVLERVAKGLVIPTDKLALALVELAVGDGEPLAAGPGVEEGGRTVANVALRRLGGM